MVEGIGQRSGMHHRLDEGSRVDHRVHQRSGMHHWDGVDDWSSMDNGNGVDDWSSMDSMDSHGGLGVGGGLHDGGNNGLHHRFAVHLGDALVGYRRGS